MDRPLPTLAAWTSNIEEHPFNPDRIAGWKGIGESLELILDDLERWAPKGLDSRRSMFRSQWKNFDALLNLRSELAIAASMARNHVNFEFMRDSPDFLCSTSDGLLGVEVTTRQRNDIVRLHDALEARLIDSQGLHIVLHRIGNEFKFDQTRLNEIVDGVALAAGTGENQTVPLLWAGITASIWQDTHSGTGAQVVWDGGIDLDKHWLGVAKELTSSVWEKGSKNYPVPTIAVIDITRLGETSHWPADEIPKNLTGQITIDNAGSLEGVILVQSGFLQSAAVTILEKWVNPAKSYGVEMVDWFERATQLSVSLKFQQRILEMVAERRDNPTEAD